MLQYQYNNIEILVMDEFSYPDFEKFEETNHQSMTTKTRGQNVSNLSRAKKYSVPLWKHRRSFSVINHFFYFIRDKKNIR